MQTALLHTGALSGLGGVTILILLAVAGAAFRFVKPLIDGFHPKLRKYL